jgi:hypothetical protein
MTIKYRNINTGKERLASFEPPEPLLIHEIKPVGRDPRNLSFFVVPKSEDEVYWQLTTEIEGSTPVIKNIDIFSKTLINELDLVSADGTEIVVWRPTRLKRSPKK